MARNELTPWRWGGLSRSGAQDRGLESWRRELEELHRSMDRVFEDVFNGGSWGSLLPEAFTGGQVAAQLDLTEDEKSYRVTVELPGLDEKDVSVSLSDRLLTISGEKKAEKEDKEKSSFRRERAYGSFRRVIEIPGDIDAEHIEARFRKGVLTIDLPKTKESQQKVRKIDVKAA